MMINRKLITLFAGMILSSYGFATPSESPNFEKIGRGCTVYNDTNTGTLNALKSVFYAYDQNFAQLPHGQSITLVEERWNESGEVLAMRLVAKVLDDTYPYQLRRFDIAFNTNEQGQTTATVLPESSFVYNYMELSEFTTPVRAVYWGGENNAFSMASNCSTDVKGREQDTSLFFRSGRYFGDSSLFYIADRGSDGNRYGEVINWPKREIMLLGKPINMFESRYGW